MNRPIFETFADTTLNRVRGTYAQRGTEYGDTWAHCQWLALKATARELGVEIPDSKLRAIAAAVLVDVKYQRLEGGFKDDSVIDGIAYNSLWAEEMQRQAQPQSENTVGQIIKGHPIMNESNTTFQRVSAPVIGSCNGNGNGKIHEEHHCHQ